jgi:SpoVK/Ycf46/Vps4 family AAA+-type ATPase
MILKACISVPLGKTMIGKVIAYKSGATFFSISSSSLASKWHGDCEKLVKTLFAVASYRAPSVVFIDEVDSLLSQRKVDESEVSRRVRTEFLVQLDGASNEKSGRVLVIGTTNLPHELDDAARRRFAKRIYIPLPDQRAREVLLRNALKKNNHSLSDIDFATLSRDTEGYSGCDLNRLCADASMGPLRSIRRRKDRRTAQSKVLSPITYEHFCRSLKGSSPSVAQASLEDYIEWDNTYGTKVTSYSDEDSSVESSNDETDD